MKKQLICTSKLILMFFFVILLVSLAFTTLYYNRWINSDLFFILNWTVGVLLYGLCGFFLVRWQKKKARICAFLCIPVFVLLQLLCLSEFTIMTILKSFSKLIMFLFSVFWLSRKYHS